MNRIFFKSKQKNKTPKFKNIEKKQNIQNSKKISKFEIKEREKKLLDYGDFVELNSKDKQNILQKKLRNQKRTKVGRIIFFFIIIILAFYEIFSFFKTKSQDAINKEKIKVANIINEQTHNFLASKIQDIKNDSLILFNLKEENEIKSFFNLHKEFIAVLSDDEKFINTEYLRQTGIQEEKLFSAIEKNKSTAIRAKYEKLCIKNVSDILGQKSAILFVPYGKRNYISVIFTTDEFEKICLNNFEYKTFVVDKRGFLIAGFEPSLVLNNQNLGENSLVKLFLEETGKTMINAQSNDNLFYGTFVEEEQGEFAVMTILETSHL